MICFAFDGLYIFGQRRSVEDWREWFLHEECWCASSDIREPQLCSMKPYKVSEIRCFMTTLTFTYKTTQWKYKLTATLQVRHAVQTMTPFCIHSTRPLMNFVINGNLGLFTFACACSSKLIFSISNVHDMTPFSEMYHRRASGLIRTGYYRRLTHA